LPCTALNRGAGVRHRAAARDDAAHLYDCCNYVSVNSKTGQIGSLAKAAIPFTAPADGVISAIDIPLLAIDGPDIGVYIQVMSSAGNVPFERKGERFLQSDLSDLGECCRYFHETPQRGIKVKAGKTYWIMVKAHDRVDGGWNVNSIGLSGQYAVQVGREGTWTLTEGPLPAVRIIAK
jgi:hypothetical protein